jgi:flagellar motility protein MotE (MotC chaperone)
MTSLFKPRSLLVLAGFFFALYFFTRPTVEQDQMAAQAVEKGSELAKRGTEKGKEVSAKLVKKVSNFIHTHAPTQALEQIERVSERGQVDRVTKKMQAKLKEYQALNEKWEDFRNQILAESDISEEDLDKISNLSEDFQDEVQGLYQALLRGNESGESASGMIDEFNSDVKNRFDSNFKKIVSEEQLQKMEDRRIEFTQWVSENYPNFTEQVKSFSWY